MRKLFFLLSVCCSAITGMAQTYTSGLTSTGSGTSTDVRLGGANPLLVNTTVDLGSFTFGFKKLSADYFTILNNGNIGINNASPAYRFDLSGTSRLIGQQILQGTLASDSASIGSELLYSTGWTSTGWTGSFSGFTHTTGNTTPLTNTTIGYSSIFYQIAYTVSTGHTGSFSITFGGVTTSGLTATGSTGIRSPVTGPLSITPTSDFNGTITISIKTINTSAPTTIFASSDGVSRMEIRAPVIGSNTYVGVSAGWRNTSGATNASFGYQAGQANTTGSANAMFGYQAGNNNTTGGQNTFIGYQAGAGTTSGLSNTFVGFQAGIYNTTANDNTFIGRAAGFTNTTGYSNTFTGNYSGFYNLGGTWNTFSGYMAGVFNSSGNSNTNYGFNAGYYNTIGANNTLLGSSAGKYTADGTSSAHVLNNSILIGYNSKPLADSQTNQLVIGYNATGLGSNTTVLGNSFTTKTAVYGSLLIGTTADTASAILNLSSTTRGVLFPRMTSAQRTAIASPAKGLLVFDNDSSSLFQWNGAVWQSLYSQSLSNSSWSLSGNAATNTATHFIGTTNNVGLVLRTNNMNRLLVDSTGNIGIGTTHTNDTAYRLFVEKGIRTRKLKVDALTLNWADYVFDKDYKLPTLAEVENFIQLNKHLPGVISASEAEKNGVDVGENQAVLLKKVEELTLYVIELDKKIRQLSADNEVLQKKVNSKPDQAHD